MHQSANGSGVGKGTHVSVFTKLLDDDQLHWPFLGTVTFELLNQLADDKHHSRVVIHGAGGCPQFLPHSSLCHDK